MAALVSVLVPCYNGEKYIDSCMQSIIEQDYPSIELVVVDDGSEDKSREKLMKWKAVFEEKGYYFQYVYQDNQGPGGATNTGLKYIHGDYLTLLDIDDVFLPGSVSERAGFLQEYSDYNAVRTNGWRVEGQERSLIVTDEEEKWQKNVFEAVLKGATNNFNSAYMVRTARLFEVYPDRAIFPSRYGQNLQILFPCLYGSKCGFIDKPLAEYRIQADSHSQTSDVSRRKQLALENMKGYYEIRCHMIKLLEKDPVKRANYLKWTDTYYSRQKMQIFLTNKDMEQAKKCYCDIKKMHMLTINDRVYYYESALPAIGFFWRVVRKLMAFW